MSQTPLPRATAWGAIARCVATSVGMLARGEVHLPRRYVDRRIRFADGTVARVFRETVVDRPVLEPCVLVVAFRLRGVRGPAHALFRAESILNTPLFVGFPGFFSKLWLADDARGTYRGLYEWDGAERAEGYARALWQVLTLVSVPGSIGYQVLPGRTRADVLAEDAPRLVAADAWWRVVGAA